MELFIWLLLIEAPVHIQQMQRLQIWMPHKSANKKLVASMLTIRVHHIQHFASLHLTNKPFHCHCISELLESLSFLGNNKICNSTNSILCWLWKANCWIAYKILSFKLCTSFQVVRSFQNCSQVLFTNFKTIKDLFTTFLSILTSWSLAKSFCWPPFVVEGKQDLGNVELFKRPRDVKGLVFTYSSGQCSGFIYIRLSVSSNIRF